MRIRALGLIAVLMVAVGAMAQTYAPKKYLVSEEMFGMVAEELRAQLERAHDGGAPEPDGGSHAIMRS